MSVRIGAVSPMDNAMDAISAAFAELWPEEQVLDLVMAGKPNKVIATDLGLSQSTIEVHRANTMKKMKVDSLAELVTLVNVSRQQ